MRDARHSTAIVLLGALAVLFSAPAAAQVGEPGPPGPFVIDVRATTSGLPDGAPFYPSITDATSVPTRGFGVDVGAHVYPFGLGPARVGIGAAVLHVRGTATTPTAASSTDPDLALPDTAATLTMVVPQFSLNFGTRDGWSYLSGGVGAGQIRTVVAHTAGDATADGGWVRSVNLGGGAKWFLTPHLAFSFDLRLHRMSAGPSTPRVTVTSVAAGMSLR